MKGRSKYLVTLVCFLFFLNGNQAQTACTEVAAEAGISHHYLSPTYMGGGAAFFDFDNDGDEDLWIAGGLNRDALYRNDGGGAFTEIGMAAGLGITNQIVTTGVITGDVDNDGFRDVLVLTHYGFYCLLFRNNGDGTFLEVSQTAGLRGHVAQSYAAAFGDVNLDGYLDFYVGNFIKEGRLIENADGEVTGFEHDCFTNWLFINNGDWTFTEMGASAGVADIGCALATTFTDFDLDHDPDILLANDFGAWVMPNALFENTGSNNQFTNAGQASGMDVGMYSMGIAVGDYDQDLDLDYYITNLGRNVLLENQGDLTYIDRAAEAGVEDTYMDSLLATGWGTAFIDVDNDADLDLFVVNGYVPAADFIANSRENRNRLFLQDNNPNGVKPVFTETALGPGLDDPGMGRGFTYSDYDNDGDLDFLVVNLNQHTSGDPIREVLLYRNDLENGHNWLKVKLEGTTANRDAYGSVIRIVAGGRAWLHEYNGGSGTHASQHSSVAHFGIGEAEVVDSLIITWPGGGQSYRADIPANQLLEIVQDAPVSGVAQPAADDAHIRLSAFPNPFRAETQIRFQLPEASYVEIGIFDVLGRELVSLSRDWYPAGTHSISWIPEVSGPASGWSIARLKTDEQIVTLKLIHQN